MPVSQAGALHRSLNHLLTPGPRPEGGTDCLTCFQIAAALTTVPARGATSLLGASPPVRLAGPPWLPVLSAPDVTSQRRGVWFLGHGLLFVCVGDRQLTWGFRFLRSEFKRHGNLLLWGRA